MPPWRGLTEIHSLSWPEEYVDILNALGNFHSNRGTFSGTLNQPFEVRQTKIKGRPDSCTNYIEVDDLAWNLSRLSIFIKPTKMEPSETVAGPSVSNQKGKFRWLFSSRREKSHHCNHICTFYCNLAHWEAKCWTAAGKKGNHFAEKKWKDEGKKCKEPVIFVSEVLFDDDSGI